MTWVCRHTRDDGLSQSTFLNKPDSITITSTSTSTTKVLRAGIVLVYLCMLAACRGDTSSKPPIHLNPNMDDQPRYNPQSENPLFADGRAERMPVPGTVPREPLPSEDTTFYLGRNSDGSYVMNNPLPITEALLRRGQERFNIYCSVCHGRVGDGKGIVAPPHYQGLLPPTSYHDDRIRKLPDGDLFNTLTNGVRTMRPYGAQVPVADRWAIIAYIRALERSQQTTVQDVPPDILQTVQ